MPPGGRIRALPSSSRRGGGAGPAQKSRILHLDHQFCQVPILGAASEFALWKGGRKICPFDKPAGRLSCVTYPFSAASFILFVQSGAVLNKQHGPEKEQGEEVLFVFLLYVTIVTSAVILPF